MSDGKKYHEKKVKKRKLEYFDWKLNETEPQKQGERKKMKEFSLKRFMNPRFIQTALSGGSNKFLYPTNANDNNNELENLYKYYKSTGQVN